MSYNSKKTIQKSHEKKLSVPGIPISVPSRNTYSRPTAGGRAPTFSAFDKIKFNEPEYIVIDKVALSEPFILASVENGIATYTTKIGISWPVIRAKAIGETAIIQLFIFNQKTHKLLSSRDFIHSLTIGELPYAFPKVNTLTVPSLQFINVTAPCLSSPATVLEITLKMNTPVTPLTAFINVARSRTLEESLSYIYMKQVRRFCTSSGRKSRFGNVFPLDVMVADFDELFLQNLEVWGSDDSANTESNDADIQTGPEKIHLTCPLSLKRMVHPGKGINCSHTSCFDLLNFLQLNLKETADWECPSCPQKLHFKDLRIDVHMKKVLQETDESVDSIIRYANGKFCKPSTLTVENLFTNTSDDAVMEFYNDEGGDSDCVPLYTKRRTKNSEENSTSHGTSQFSIQPTPEEEHDPNVIVLD